MDKRTYEAVKSIRNKVATGQTTTFAERNYLAMMTKREEKRKKLRASVVG